MCDIAGTALAIDSCAGGSEEVDVARVRALRLAGLRVAVESREARVRLLVLQPERQGPRVHDEFPQRTRQRVPRQELPPTETRHRQNTRVIAIWRG